MHSEILRLCLTCLPLEGFLFFFLSFNTLLTSRLTSIVKYFSTKSGSEPAAGWPQNGEIRIDNLSVRYAEDLEAVLKNVSVYLKSGEKVKKCSQHIPATA